MGDAEARTVVAELVVWADDDSEVLTVEAVTVDAAADARDMTAEEAVAQAAREGLVLVKSRNSRTGYFGVHFDNRDKNLKYRYSVYLEGATSGLYTKRLEETQETPARRSQRSGKARALWLEVEEPASDDEEYRLV